jgi:signal transduction histidine kinase/CheY-like chemotaxis protein
MSLRSVLVVDDRVTNREYLASLLGAAGFEVLEAEDGAHALEVARGAQPALVIADILMPKMDGYQFVRALRRDPRHAQTPVIFISGQYAEREARMLADRCGVSEILVKPAEPETILAAIERVLASRGEPQTTTALHAGESFEQLHRRILIDTLARKAEELEASNRRLAALVMLCRRLASEHEPRRLVQVFCGSAAEIMGCRYVMVALRDVVGNELRHIAASGQDNAVVASITSAVATNSALLAEARGAPMHIRNAEELIDKALAPAFLPQTPFIIVPVTTAVRSYGALYFGQLTGARPEDGSDVEFASTLAAQLGIAYENAARYEQMQRHSEELQIEISDRRRAQEEARRLTAELERRVEERTRDLEATHQQLRLSERMASLGTLCAGLGHDMGNLLLPIRAHLDAVERVGTGAALSPHFSAIAQCVGYLQSLTNGLRMLSFDSRESDADAETDLATWRDEIAPLLTSALPGGIRLECRIGDDLPLVQISRQALSQAVFNIVNNAADALRGRGTGEITISAAVLPDGDSVRLYVRDDGPGMPPEVKARVLDPFFTTKRRAFSTGLGMTLVHSAVKKAGGAIEIESDLGRGTTISLLLPARRHAPDGDDALVESKPVASVSFRDPRSQAIVTKLLQSMGYDTRVELDLDSAAIWLTEAESARLDEARSFLEKRPDGRIAVAGAIDDDWKRLGAVHLGEKLRPSEIRQRLREFAIPNGRS